jgi:membrane-bound lytic murein transglycosylase D
MEWLGNRITNPINLSKFILVAFALVAGSWAGSNWYNAGSAYPSGNDTTRVLKIGFESLFASEKYNPALPYTSQLNPKATLFVQEYIRKQGEELEKMKFWGKPYFDLYDNILSQYDIPKEMKYLSVIESHLTPGLVSWAGAVGPWQIMADEAHRFGLKTGYHDERTDFYKSTHVAARLMKELYAEFGDWLLVVAAYNGGAGRMRQAIRKSGSRDFWDLQYYLPEETRNHVKKFIGTHYIFEGSGGVTTLTAAETARIKALTPQPLPDLSATHDKIYISGRYLSSIVAPALGIDLANFLAVNPAFDRELAAGKLYPMHLPSGTGKKELFETKKSTLLMESLQKILQGAEAIR